MRYLSYLIILFSLCRCSIVSQSFFLTGQKQLVQMVIHPANPSVIIGDNQTFTITAVYSDESTQDLTSSVTWSKTNGTGTAAIDATGKASSLTSGTVFVTASVNGMSATTTMNVKGYTSSTVAGVFWPTAENGNSATLAPISVTGSPAFDTSGNYYIAESSLNVVRRVDAVTGNIAVVAGTGNPGYTGDGGPATSAELNAVQGVAVDSGGNLYIATGGNVVRKVDPSGIISTFAGNGTAGYAGDGGPAASAELDGPTGVAVDHSGNVYIADMANHLIRKVDGLTSIITTVVGSRTPSCLPDTSGTCVAIDAFLTFPSGLTLDSGNNLYFMDPPEGVIAEVPIATGKISDLTGTVLGFSGDGGPAVNALVDLLGSSASGIAVDSSGNVYIADSVNNRIRRIDAITHDISTVVGSGPVGTNTGSFSGDGGPATNATLNTPTGIAIDPSTGDLYVADTSNSRVRKVSAGNISTVVGTGGYAGDGGAATNGQINNPNGVAVDPLGNLYIADSANCVVRKVTASNGLITTIAGIGGSCGYSGDGGAATAAQLNGPESIILDSSGNIFVSDTANARVRKITPGGTISTVAGNGTAGYLGDGGAATAAEIDSANGIFVDSNFDLYIADYGNSVIRKVMASTGNISTVAGNNTSGYTGDGGLATSSELSRPSSVCVDSQGAIYIADTANLVIRKVDPLTGNISTIAGTGVQGYAGDGGPATQANFNWPVAIVVDPSGNLFISDASSFLGPPSVIRKIDASNGNIVTVAGTGAPAFAGDGGSANSASMANPLGLTIDAIGNIFVSDSGNNVIRKLTPMP
jgi:trimeric autotransporter adhesin